MRWLAALLLLATRTASLEEAPAGSLHVRLPLDHVRLPAGSPLAVDFVVLPSAGWATAGALRVCLGVFYDLPRAATFQVQPQRDSLWCDDAAKWVNVSATFHAHAPLELAGIRPGEHVLWVLIQDAEGRVLGEPHVVQFGVVEAVFEPTYSWQRVADGQSVPGGLEVRMDLSGAGKLARIPASWRLQIWLDEASRFFRVDVSPSSRVAKLAEGAAKLLLVDPGCVTVVDANVPAGHPPMALPPGATVEEIRLFQRQRTLKFHVDPSCASSAAALRRPISSSGGVQARLHHHHQHRRRETSTGLVLAPSTDQGQGHDSAGGAE